MLGLGKIQAPAILPGAGERAECRISPDLRVACADLILQLTTCPDLTLTCPDLSLERSCAPAV